MLKFLNHIFFTIKHYRDGKLISSRKMSNPIVDKGVNRTLDVKLNANAQNRTWSPYDIRN